MQTNINDVNYYWNNGSTSQSITVNSEGLYWLELEKNGCTLKDSIVLSKIPVTQIDLGLDNLVCTNKSILLDAGVSQGTYLWNTGDTTKTISINKPGKYYVTVLNAGGCLSSDTIKVTLGNCDLFIPSAFSPNADGLNDMFGLVDGINISSFSMKIFNRNGLVIFSSSDQFKKWDGLYKNKPVPVGSYPWVLSYTNNNGYKQIEKGTVMLIR